MQLDPFRLLGSLEYCLKTVTNYTTVYLNLFIHNMQNANSLSQYIFHKYCMYIYIYIYIWRVPMQKSLKVPSEIFF